MSNQRRQSDSHVTKQPTFSRSLLPDKSRSRIQPTVLSSLGNLKRQTGEPSTGDSSRKTKKSKTLTLSPTTTSLSVAGMVPEAEGTPNSFPAVPLSPDFTASKTSTSFKLPGGNDSLLVRQPSASLATSLELKGDVQSSPIRLSTSNFDPDCIAPSRSSSHRSSSGPKAQNYPQAQQASESNDTVGPPLKGVQGPITHEFAAKVYVHTKFFDEFLETNQAIQDRVLERVRQRASDQSRSLGPVNHVDYDDTNNRWTIDKAIMHQRNKLMVYEPLAKCLNVICEAAFEIYQEIYPGDTIRRGFTPFINHHANKTLYDSPTDDAVAPDFLQGKATRGNIQWTDVETIFECRSTSSTEHRNDANMQVARYSWSGFAHQICRTSMLALTLCGSIVNFIHLDRSGMLISPDLDLTKPDEAHSFIQHMITLITLDSSSYGYDNRYSFDYSVNPPLTLFKFGDRAPEPVNEILYHRKCCCGPAVCVTSLGELVHKAIWRPEDQTDEGKILSGFISVFGFCQMEDASCDIYTTRLKYPKALEWTEASMCFLSPGRTPDSKTVQWEVRVKSDTLIQRGVSLFDAQNPLHLVLAIHDAIFGIMALTEVGKLHRDVSTYNLLLTDPKKHYPNQKWLGEPKFKVIPDVWEHTARRPLGATADRVGQGQANSEYESPRLKLVKELGRGPYCVLHDTELVADAEDNGNIMDTDSTGTPTFISAQLLTAEQPIARTFMHDIESLFWVLLWVLIHQTQDPDKPWRINEHAKKMKQKLSSSDLKTLGEYKASLIRGSVDGTLWKSVKKLENPWCEDLWPVLEEFGVFLFYYFYCKVSPRPVQGALAELRKQTLSIMDVHLDRLHLETFKALFEIFNNHIRTLESKYRVEVTKL